MRRRGRLTEGQDASSQMSEYSELMAGAIASHKYFFPNAEIASDVDMIEAVESITGMCTN